MKICVKCGSKEFTVEGSITGDILTCMNCGGNDFIEQNKLKATFKNFEVKASYKGTKKVEWSKDNFNNHMITVTNTDNKKKITFEFWASISHPVLTTDYDLLNAFYCFVGDAISGSETFDEFCGNFGYDNDSITALKIYRKCQKAYKKLSNIYDGDIYELSNELSEIAG